ncbi:MAG: hypothetical protein KDB27_18625 [Planctomycetales bacterium]|nr:hypothetical protein [Planctomycetales bacterium]
MTNAVAWLNDLANALGGICLGPIAWLPGWLSATLVGAVTGVLMLIAFKYTSHQSAIKTTRDHIKANLIALSLFKDDVRVGLRAQGRILANAGKLLLLSLVPMLVMTIPMVLVLGQLALWYQARPLRVGEEAVMTVQLAPTAEHAVANISLQADEAIDLSIGPVRVPAKQMVCWNITPKQQGLHEVSVNVGDQQFTKQLAVSDGFMATSLKRPARQWTEMLLHPLEPAFVADSPVQSIEISFPDRESWTAGTDYWIIYWFAVSMIAAFAVKPFFNVNI